MLLWSLRQNFNFVEWNLFSFNLESWVGESRGFSKNSKYKGHPSVCIQCVRNYYFFTWWLHHIPFLCVVKFKKKKLGYGINVDANNAKTTFLRIWHRHFKLLKYFLYHGQYYMHWPYIPLHIMCKWYYMKNHYSVTYLESLLPECMPVTVVR